MVVFGPLEYVLSGHHWKRLYDPKISPKIDDSELYCRSLKKLPNSQWNLCVKIKMLLQKSFLPIVLDVFLFSTWVSTHFYLQKKCIKDLETYVLQKVLENFHYKICLHPKNTHTFIIIKNLIHKTGVWCLSNFDLCKFMIWQVNEKVRNLCRSHFEMKYRLYCKN